jgi:hypothetical protein
MEQARQLRPLFQAAAGMKLVTENFAIKLYLMIPKFQK